MKSFLEVFTPRKISDGEVAEFPLDILTPGTEKIDKILVMTKSGGTPELTGDGDYAFIPTYPIWSQKDLERDAGILLFDAAIRRHLCTYDATEEGGVFSNGLLKLMNQQMIRHLGGSVFSKNRGQITDLFIREDTKIRSTVCNSVKIHAIDDDLWRGLVANSKVDGHCDAKNELAIGINLTDCDSFVCPVRDNYCAGLAVLDFRHLILGRF